MSQQTDKQIPGQEVVLANSNCEIDETLTVDIDSLKRSPREGYLEACFGFPAVSNSLFDDLRAGYYLDSSLQIHPDYQEHAELAIQYLWDNMEKLVVGYPEFRLLLDEYSERSAYSTSVWNQKPDTLNEEVSRDVWVPVQLKHLVPVLTKGFSNSQQVALIADLLNAIPQIRRSSRYHIPFDLVPLEERVEGVRVLVKETLQNKDLDKAILMLYTMERSWLWYYGNSSRSMNFFNVVLKKIGYKPISHGIIDFTAFLMDNFEDFRRYVLFVMRDVEKQEI